MSVTSNVNVVNRLTFISDLILDKIKPSPRSKQKRESVFQYIRDIIIKTLGNDVEIEVDQFGSLPLGTFLPDGDIDLVIIPSPSHPAELRQDWCKRLVQALVHEMNQQSQAPQPYKRNQSNQPVMRIRDPSVVPAEVQVVKCMVNDVKVDIVWGQKQGLGTLCFLEFMDRVAGYDHLLKRSIMLIKAWAYYETRILGSHNFLLSTYALETLVLFIINHFYGRVLTPLDVFREFLQYFGSFPWELSAITVWGPVPKEVLYSGAAPPLPPADQEGVGALLSSEEVRQKLAQYTYQPEEGEPKPIQVKFLNIVDPLNARNNLGRSVSRQGFNRVVKVLGIAAAQMQRLFAHTDEEEAGKEFERFFRVTLQVCNHMQAKQKGQGGRQNAMVSAPPTPTGANSTHANLGSVDSNYLRQALAAAGAAQVQSGKGGASAAMLANGGIPLPPQYNGMQGGGYRGQGAWAPGPPAHPHPSQQQLFHHQQQQAVAQAHAHAHAQAQAQAQGRSGQNSGSFTPRGGQMPAPYARSFGRSASQGQMGYGPEEGEERNLSTGVPEGWTGHVMDPTFTTPAAPPGVAMAQAEGPAPQPPLDRQQRRGTAGSLSASSSSDEAADPQGSASEPSLSQTKGAEGAPAQEAARADDPARDAPRNQPAAPSAESPRGLVVGIPVLSVQPFSKQQHQQPQVFSPPRAGAYYGEGEGADYARSYPQQGGRGRFSPATAFMVGGTDATRGKRSSSSHSSDFAGGPGPSYYATQAGSRAPLPSFPAPQPSTSSAHPSPSSSGRVTRGHHRATSLEEVPPAPAPTPGSTLELFGHPQLTLQPPQPAPAMFAVPSPRQGVMPGSIPLPPGSYPNQARPGQPPPTNVRQSALSASYEALYAAAARGAGTLPLGRSSGGTGAFVPPPRSSSALASPNLPQQMMQQLLVSQLMHLNAQQQAHHHLTRGPSMPVLAPQPSGGPSQEDAWESNLHVFEENYNKAHSANLLGSSPGMYTGDFALSVPPSPGGSRAVSIGNGLFLPPTDPRLLAVLPGGFHGPSISASRRESPQDSALASQEAPSALALGPPNSGHFSAAPSRRVSGSGDLPVLAYGGEVPVVALNANFTEKKPDHVGPPLPPHGRASRPRTPTTDLEELRRPSVPSSPSGGGSLPRPLKSPMRSAAPYVPPALRNVTASAPASPSLQVRAAPPGEPSSIAPGANGKSSRSKLEAGKAAGRNPSETPKGKGQVQAAPGQGQGQGQVPSARRALDGQMASTTSSLPDVPSTPGKKGKGDAPVHSSPHPEDPAPTETPAEAASSAPAASGPASSSSDVPATSAAADTPTKAADDRTAASVGTGKPAAPSSSPTVAAPAPSSKSWSAVVSPGAKASLGSERPPSFTSMLVEKQQKPPAEPLQPPTAAAAKGKASANSAAAPSRPPVAPSASSATSQQSGDEQPSSSGGSFSLVPPSPASRQPSFKDLLLGNREGSQGRASATPTAWASNSGATLTFPTPPTTSFGPPVAPTGPQPALPPGIPPSPSAVAPASSKKKKRGATGTAGADGSVPAPSPGKSKQQSKAEREAAIAAANAAQNPARRDRGVSPRVELNFHAEDEFPSLGGPPLSKPHHHGPHRPRTASERSFESLSSTTSAGRESVSSHATGGPRKSSSGAASSANAGAANAELMSGFL